MSTMPIRIDGNLVEAAKRAGKIHRRSAAQQLDYWARIGRELESAPGVSHDAIERVLTGRLPYDEAGEHAQAVVRAAWDEGIAQRIAALDLTDELAAAGRPWAESDDEGLTVVRDPHDR